MESNQISFKWTIFFHFPLSTFVKKTKQFCYEDEIFLQVSKWSEASKQATQTKVHYVSW